jgi:hypothetical protein
LPIFNPQIYLDIATFNNAKRELSSGGNSLMEAGLELHFTNALAIYVPLFLSSDFKAYTKSNYPENRLLNSISFSLNLKEINIFNTQKAGLNLVN